jgi:cytochrome c oxidase cbb3-type subunit 3
VYGQHASVSYLFVGILAIELLFVVLLSFVLLRVFRILKEQKEGKKTTLMDRLNASVAVEKEQDIMLDHNYDGIRELDNDLPPWWIYGFYLSIVFAAVYMVHYHVTGTGKLQIDEYEQQLTDANRELEEYQRNAANKIDETNVTLVSDPAILESAKVLFVKNCAPCHGPLGEGNAVGPNLTDKFWIHGGSLPDVFKSVKYGWPEKGMKSWQKDLGAKQIQEVASYIASLQGSNPPNAKEAQGEPYEEKK